MYKYKTHTPEVDKEKKHMPYTHLLKGISSVVICFMFLFIGINVVSATITGIPPNPSGDTIIDKDTVWDGEIDVLCGGNIFIGNSTEIIDVTFINSNNITINDDLIIGGLTGYAVNFTIYNSTINWGSNESELILDYIDDAYGTQGSILNISFSTIQREPSAISYLETLVTNRALGLYLKSAPRWPYDWGYNTNTVKIKNTTLAHMGRYYGRHPATTRWLSGNYGAISTGMLQTGSGTGYNYTTDSYLENITFWNCEHAYLGVHNPSSTPEPFSTYKNFNLSCPPEVPMSQGAYTPTNGQIGYIMGLQNIGGAGCVIENLYSNGVARVTDAPQPGTTFINAEIHQTPESWKTLGMFLPNITWIDSEFWYIIGDTGNSITTGGDITYENCIFHRSGYGEASYNFTVINCTQDISPPTGSPYYFASYATNTLVRDSTFKNISGNALIGDYMNLHGEYVTDITLHDIVFYNLTGVGTIIDYPAPSYNSVYFINVDGLTMYNVSFDTVRSSIHLKNIINSTFTNISGSDFYDFADQYGAIILKNCKNNIWRNINIDGKLVFYDDFGTTLNNKFINAYFSEITLDSSYFLPYYYLDVKVVDTNGNPIENAIVTITNEVDSNYPSINVNGENKISFVTGVDGHTPLPSDLSNSAAILDFWQNSATKTEMGYTITVEKGGESNIATINPDETWYRSDQNTYQNTVTVVLETGSDTISPAIIGHSPTGTNVNTGTKITTAFSETMNTYSVESAFSISPSVSGSFSWDGNMMIFSPESDLSYDTTYTVNVNTTAKDLADIPNHIESQYSWNFTTSILDNGLIGEWHFNEGSGSSATDSSGYDNHGTLTNMEPASDWVDGKLGKALDFDGVDDYVDSGNDAILMPTDAITLVAWVKTNSLIQEQFILCKDGWVTGYGYDLRIGSDGKYHYRIRNLDNGLNNAISADVPDTDWHHVVVTYNKVNLTIYVDGIESGLVNENKSLGYSSNLYNFKIGQISPLSYSSPFNGVIDEVKIYNRALSAEEILADYETVIEDKTPLDGTISITPSATQITPNTPFTLTIPITPATPITGAQFDLLFDSSLATVTTVTEGNLLNQDGASTLFNSGTINNVAGTVTDVYGSILGSTSVSSQGSLATISMTAGSNTGYLNLNLTNLIISDADSNPAPYTLTNTTILIDTAPVLASIGARSVDEENELAFTLSASDADGDSLAYSATNLPAGASLNPVSGAFSWTPADGDAGTYVVTFEVTDGYLSDSEAVTITVTDVNNVPVITAFTPADGSVFGEVDTINIDVTATDADGQALSYIIKINGVTKSTTSSYAWETDYSNAGAHTIDVTVSDGIVQVTDQHIININDVHPRWDVNIDGVVNILDISLIGQKQGSFIEAPYPRWDVNQDGVVNVQDLTVVGYYFGQTIV